ncbi:putative PEP-binding protein [Streptomyces atratus]|uniref:putative PEP-binding protein n=1 Tax=Streptomyces atratus TaxID=1893 RepID=UPI0032464B7C
MARIAASRWPDPVVVRTSDFKTNEYARLLGGRSFEPVEANPMIGWRGASRYYSDGYREGFALECRALRRVRDEMGLTNVVVMIPFCRTLEEADRVLDVMAEQGLRRGEHGLKVYVMAEIPSNVILAEDFAERFDGFSVGSNDLTQLTLGVDRDSEALAHVFDETDPAVTQSIQLLVPRAHLVGRTVGLCGQRPSDDPAFTEFLVKAGIDSISVAPDSFAAVKQHVAAAELDPQRGDRTVPSGTRQPQAGMSPGDGK